MEAQLLPGQLTHDLKLFLFLFFPYTSLYSLLAEHLLGFLGIPVMIEIHYLLKEFILFLFSSNNQVIFLQNIDNVHVVPRYKHIQFLFWVTIIQNYPIEDISNLSYLSLRPN